MYIACNINQNGFKLLSKHFRQNVKYHFHTENAYFIGSAGPENLVILDSASGFKSDDFGGSANDTIALIDSASGVKSDDVVDSIAFIDSASGYKT